MPPVYGLALEKGLNRATYHAVAKEGVTALAIAEAIGRGRKIPVVSLSPEEEGFGHFGWLGMFVGYDMPVLDGPDESAAGVPPAMRDGPDDRGPRSHGLVGGLNVPARESFDLKRDGYVKG